MANMLPLIHDCDDPAGHGLAGHWSAATCSAAAASVQAGDRPAIRLCPDLLHRRPLRPLNRPTLVRGPEVAAALHFDGASMLEHRQPAAWGYPCTLACWFNAQARGGQALMAISAQGAGWSNCFLLFFDVDRVRAAARSDAQGILGFLTCTTSAAANRWHHAAAVFASPASVTVYHNGGGAVSRDSNASPNFSGDSFLTLGGICFTPGAVTDPLHGLIAEASLYHRALTPVEVRDLARRPPLSGPLRRPPRPPAVRPVLLIAAAQWRISDHGAAALTVDIPRDGYDLHYVGDTQVPWPSRPTLSLRASRRQWGIPSELLPAPDRAGAVLVRRRDSHGRSDGGTTCLRFQNRGGRAAVIPLAPVWPAEADWPVPVVGGQVLLPLVYERPLGDAGAAEAILQSRDALGRVEAVTALRPTPGQRALRVILPLPPAGTCFRWRVRHAGGGWLDTPWSRPVSPLPVIAAVPLNPWEVTP